MTLEHPVALVRTQRNRDSTTIGILRGGNTSTTILDTNTGADAQNDGDESCADYGEFDKLLTGHIVFYDRVVQCC